MLGFRNSRVSGLGRVAFVRNVWGLQTREALSLSPARAAVGVPVQKFDRGADEEGRIVPSGAWVYKS